MRLFFIIGLIFLLSRMEIHAQSLDYELETYDGEWIFLDEIDGEKLTVIDFWASWCKPCMKALPKLELLHIKYKEKGVSFIGVNTDGPRNISKIKPIVKAFQLTYKIFKDINQDLMSEFNVNSLPTLIILDHRGKQVYRHTGFKLGDEKLIAQKIDHLLLK